MVEKKNKNRNRKRNQNREDKDGNPLFGFCPECGGCIEVTGLNCHIFRHGVGLKPHATDAQIVAWKKSKNGQAGLGCGAKLRWNEGKFIIYYGYDQHQKGYQRPQRRGNKKGKKNCMICKKKPYQPRYCSNCKETVCGNDPCIDQCENKCPQCWQESAFQPNRKNKQQNKDEQSENAQERKEEQQDEDEQQEAEAIGLATMLSNMKELQQDPDEEYKGEEEESKAQYEEQKSEANSADSDQCDCNENEQTMTPADTVAPGGLTTSFQNDKDAFDDQIITSPEVNTGTTVQDGEKVDGLPFASTPPPTLNAPAGVNSDAPGN